MGEEEGFPAVGVAHGGERAWAPELAQLGVGVGNSLRRGRAGARGPIITRVHTLGQRHRTDGPWHLPGRHVLLGGQVGAPPEVKDLPQLVRVLGVLWSMRTRARHRPPCPAPSKGPCAPR